MVPTPIVQSYHIFSMVGALSTAIIRRKHPAIDVFIIFCGLLHRSRRPAKSCLWLLGRYDGVQKTYHMIEVEKICIIKANNDAHMPKKLQYA